MTAAISTRPKATTTRTPGGSPATSLIRGRFASRSLRSLRMTMIVDMTSAGRRLIPATAPGTGKNALEPTGKKQSARMTAVGFTPPSLTGTGMTTTGSAATSMIRGSIADETTAIGLLEQQCPATWPRAASLSGSSSRSA